MRPGRQAVTEVHYFVFSIGENSAESPCIVAAFEVNSEPHTGARPSVRLSVGLISPTHKRTEGRAPVWGSEFTSKRRRTTGEDPAETAVG